MTFPHFRARPSGGASHGARLPRLLMIALLVIGFTAGMGADHLSGMVTGSARASSTLMDTPEFQTFQQTWDLIHEYYVDEDAIDDQELLYGASRGMVDTLGDTGHTTFLDPEEAAFFDESLSGEFIGIGVELDFTDGQPRVIAPIDGSPAEAAGIRSGDVITEVDGVPTEGLNGSQVSKLIRGDEGTDVVLTIVREGEPEPLTISITRAKIIVEVVSWTMLPGKIAFVRLAEFSDGSTEKMIEALRAVQRQGAEGIILDLRDNPGGLLDDAIGIASQFLSEGDTVYQFQERNSDPAPVTATGGGLATDLPIVVLINEGSASSAEIVAAGVRDNGRGTLVGQTTFGTGTVLTPFTLDDGSVLLLGTGQWLTPNGEVAWHVGIEPDIEVALPLDESRARPQQIDGIGEQQFLALGDAQLLAAWSELTGADGKRPGDKDR